MILEAGASDGSDTEQFARMFPKGHIHAFEPVPSAFRLLRERTARFSNVSTYPLALGDEESVEAMHIGGRYHNSSSSSLLAPKETFDYFPDVTFETAQVNVTTIQAWAAREGIDRVDGMWLDMQGYELAALKAGGSVLQTTRAIALEVSTAELYEGLPLWPEVRAWLEDNGFRVEREDLYHEATGDALVVRA